MAHYRLNYLLLLLATLLCFSVAGCEDMADRDRLPRGPGEEAPVAPPPAPGAP